MPAKQFVTHVDFFFFFFTGAALASLYSVNFPENVARFSFWSNIPTISRGFKPFVCNVSIGNFFVIVMTLKVMFFGQFEPFTLTYENKLAANSTTVLNV